MLAVYAARVASGEARAGDDLTEVGWFPLTDLPDLAFPARPRILEAWLTPDS